MNEDRIAAVKERLAGLEPVYLDVIDESHLHIGHPGAQTGMAHIRIKISSYKLDKLNKVKQHQSIYKSLGSMMQTDLHAVAIEIIPIKT